MPDPAYQPYPLYLTSRAMLTSLLLLLLTQVPAEPRVCPDPQSPCAGFAAHDLSFPLPQDGRAYGDLKSAPFYAVILLSGDRCVITEAQRADAQTLVPRSKVFSTRFECAGNVENNVTYTNVDAKRGFLAVYGGEDAAAAGKVLDQVKSTGKFPGANLRRMQVVFLTP